MSRLLFILAAAAAAPLDAADYPTNYACPSAVLRDPKSRGENFGATDVMSPWSGAVSEEDVR